MSVASYILGILSAVLVLVVVIEMLRRRRLRERHAAWWLVAGVVALVVGIFPGLLEVIATALGVAVPTNLVFFVSIAVLFLVCLQLSAEITTAESQNRRLAEIAADHDLRLRDLEARETAARDDENGMAP